MNATTKGHAKAAPILMSSTEAAGTVSMPAGDERIRRFAETSPQSAIDIKYICTLVSLLSSISWYVTLFADLRDKEGGTVRGLVSDFLRSVISKLYMQGSCELSFPGKVAAVSFARRTCCIYCRHDIKDRMIVYILDSLIIWLLSRLPDRVLLFPFRDFRGTSSRERWKLVQVLGFQFAKARQFKANL